MIENKVGKTLNKYIWLALFVFLIFMALSAETINYSRVSKGVDITFFETILLQTNESQLLLFPFMFILLLFTQNENGVISKEQTPFKLLQRAFLSSALFVLFFIVANLIKVSKVKQSSGQNSAIYGIIRGISTIKSRGITHGIHKK